MGCQVERGRIGESRLVMSGGPVQMQGKCKALCCNRQAARQMSSLAVAVTVAVVVVVVEMVEWGAGCRCRGAAARFLAAIDVVWPSVRKKKQRWCGMPCCSASGSRQLRR